MNRRMPTGTYGGVRGWGEKASAYSIGTRLILLDFNYKPHGERNSSYYNGHTSNINTE